MEPTFLGSAPIFAMHRHRLLLSLAFWPIFCLNAQESPPIGTLGEHADSVFFATIDEILQPGGTVSSELSLGLHVTRALKGPALSEAIVNIKAQAPRGLGPISISNEWVGKSGIWFIRKERDQLMILPRNRIRYQSRDLFLPVPDISPPDGTLEQQLVIYQVRWYESLQQPGMDDDLTFLTAFYRVKPEEVPIYVKPLIDSRFPAQHAIGLTASLRYGSTDALNMFIDDIPSLPKDRRFGDILMAIGVFPHNNPEWIEPLQRMIALHRNVPGVEAAASGALMKLGSRDMLPTVIAMLDSNDPNVVLGAARYLANFARFADKNGNIQDSGSNGPLFTQDTDTYRPLINPRFPVDEYRNFWKTWWTQNKARIPGMASIP